MSPELWQEVLDIWPRIEGCPPKERASMLRRVCGDRADLHDELWSLLQSEDQAGAFLEKPVLHVDEGWLAEPTDADAAAGEDDWTGRRLGAFELRRVLGQGGMGVVFLGRRIDGEVEQEVAVKVIRRPLLGTDLEERFRTERQILAKLEHPYIARLLDAGTDDHCPYEVMEYVQGVPITAFCEREGHSIPQRLRLMIKVCEAVQAAHAQDIVHRDLKPANILVTDRGVPKLLDFGIAKRLDRWKEHGTTLPLMTPAFASPEQLAQQPVTAASDVYSLGVLLYLLATGELPFAQHHPDPLELRQRMQAGPPRSPSQVVTRMVRQGLPWRRREPEFGVSPRGRRSLGGDLDRVILKALSLEPEHRYADAAALGDDLLRVVERRPVRARPPSLGYRLHRLIQRHRTAAISLGVLALACGALGFVSWQQADQRTAHARVQSDLQRQADDMIRLLEETFKEADPYTSSENLTEMRQTLAQHTARVRRDMAHQPGLQGRLLGTLGSLHEKLGLYEEADALLRQSLALRAQAFGPRHPEVALAKKDLAWLQVLQGDPEHGFQLLEESLGIERQMSPGDPKSLSVTLNRLALVEEHRGRYTAAEQLHREALALRREIDKPTLVAESLHNIAAILTRQGRLDEAEAAAEESLLIARSSLGEDGLSVAETQMILAGVAERRGEFGRAIELLQQALGMARSKLGEHHPTVGVMLNNLANSLRISGRRDEAEDAYRQALAVHRAVFGEDHVEVATTLFNLGALRQRLGDSNGADELFEAAVERFRRIRGDEHPTTAYMMARWAQLLQELGRAKQAVPLARDALEVLRRQLGEEHPRSIFGMTVLATTLQDQGDWAGAEVILDRALKLASERPDETPWRSAQVLFPMAELRVEQGRLEEAETIYRRALLAHRDAPPYRQLTHHRMALGRTDVMVRLGRSDEAKALFQEHYLSLCGAVSPQHPFAVAARSVEGALRWSLGEKEAGLRLLESSSEQLHRSLGPRAPMSVKAKQRLLWARSGGQTTYGEHLAF